MSRILAPVAFVLVLGAAAAPVPPADKAEKREKLDTAMAELIRLLEAKEYKTVLEQFARPDTLKKLTEHEKLEDIAKKFGEGKAEKLLAAVKSIKDAKPTMSDEDKKATFELKEEALGRKSISFVKIDKYWYIDTDK